MADLCFRFGAMNSSKSSHLMQVAHNYNENDFEVAIIKSALDTKGEDYLESRVGLKRKVDILLRPEDSIEKYYDYLDKKDCILVDEAQFLTEKQVEDLWVFTKMYDKPVICYGLKTNFQSYLFPGSKRLLELSDNIEELSTLCKCGEKAKFNARFQDGLFTYEGDSILIDGEDNNIEYKPLCGKCYIKKYSRQ